MTACLEFGGLKDEKGYGRIWINGRYVFAHRFSFCVANGIQLSEIDGLIIRHACDNPSCINPGHLCAGTNQENANDMVDRKRQAFGNRNGKAKLSEEEVLEILRIYEPHHPEFGAKPLSKRFNVTAGQIAKIGRGEKWSHLQK